jgi:hypothetical protein
LVFAWTGSALEPALLHVKAKLELGEIAMSLRKYVYTSAFFASMTLVAGLAYADGQSGSTANDGQTAPVAAEPAPGPTTKPVDDVRFECDFFAAFSAGKGESSEIRCDARGRMSVDTLHDFFFSTGDADDFLKFRCRDRDDRPYYSGPISFGTAPQIVDADGDNGDGRRFNAIITGVKTTAPIIVVQNIDLRRLKHDGSSSDEASDGRREFERYAAVTFNWYGYPLQVPGVCRLRVDHHGSNGN